MKFSPANAQHIGARAEQQDSFGFSDPDDQSFAEHGGIVAVVADGMGGLANGGAASSTAVVAFLNAYALKEASEPVPDALLRSIHSANEAVNALSRSTGAKDDLGTTLAAAVLHEQWLYWVSAGDSRVYIFQDGQLVRLTTDHVYAADLDDEVSKGHITREQASAHPERDALTSYLGLPALPRVDRSVRAFPVKPGDCVLICSDGLYRALPEEEIAAGIEKNAHATCESLVERALAKHNAQQDNVTVIALKCKGETSPDRVSKTVSTPLVKPLPAAAALAVLIAAGIFLWRQSAPRIQQFTIDQARIQTGQSATLRWSVSKGTVFISPEPGRMDRNTGARSVSPSRKTRYTLIARNLFGSDLRSIDVDVIAPRTESPALPSIVVFRADPPAVKAGGSVVLSWQVESNGGEVTLNGEKVKALDSRTIPNLRGAAKYTLTARGPGGQTAARDLRVDLSADRPTIALFTATPNSVAAGKPVVLKWSVEDATSVRIDPAPGAELKPMGAQKVIPLATTIYVLTAKGTGTPVTAKTTVTVTSSQRSQVKATGASEARATAQLTVDALPAPKIEMFQPVPDGEGWRLKWQITGADRPGTLISIQPGIGPVGATSPADGLEIKAPFADRYTLTVEGPGAAAQSKQAILQPQSGPPQ